MDNEIPQEERLLAALAHASLIAGGLGIVVGLLIYVTQREKSAWLAGQALQAIAYQLAGLLVIIIIWTLWGICYTLSFIPMIRAGDQYQDAPPPIFWFGLGSMICPFLIMGAWGLYGLWGAVRAWMGADFRYAVIGRLVSQRLAPK